VLLLGGPNTYLPFLQECWRLRIPQTWDERGYDWPRDRPIEETIFVPQNAQYYAALGAVLYGLHEEAHVGAFTTVEPLNEYITTGRKARLGETAGPPLSKTQNELDDFRAFQRLAFGPLERLLAPSAPRAGSSDSGDGDRPPRGGDGDRSRRKPFRWDDRDRDRGGRGRRGRGRRET